MALGGSRAKDNNGSSHLDVGFPMLTSLPTCRKSADALHGKNLSVKPQGINCFSVFVTTRKITAYLISILLPN